MKCIKTGFTLYIESIDKWTRVDLFFDGRELYVNRNVLIDGKPDEIDGTCTSLSDGVRHFKMLNPTISKNTIEYVCDGPWAGHLESNFKRMFG